MQAFLLATTVELFDWTQLVKELLIDQSWNQQETVARHKLINGLLFQSPGLSLQNQNVLLKMCLKQQDNLTSRVKFKKKIFFLNLH